LRRKGFRFIALADDNFYPVTLTDLQNAERQRNASKLAELKAIRKERFELMARLADLPNDMVFYTQITMEAAEDTDFLDAMRKARIKGALVGVEAVTNEGLKAVFKSFNCAGEQLVTRLKQFREHGIHVLGSFIFGLPTDTEDTFVATAELAQRSGITFAQFVMLTPFPGTVDFNRWTSAQENQTEEVDGVPLTKYWLIPPGRRPKMFTPHPSMTPNEIQARTQGVWDVFYSMPAIWERSRCVSSIRARLAFLFVSKLYRQMYAGTGIASDSARQGHARLWARLLAIPCRRLFQAKAMPNLAIPRTTRADIHLIKELQHPGSTADLKVLG
jgi:Radical SAM superfamily